MNIGIAAPIEVASLKKHLLNLTSEELTLGLGGTAINILIDGFISDGHHVTVFTLDRTLKKMHLLEGPNLKIYLGTFRTSLKYKILDFCRVEYRQIQNFIELEKDNIDIINAHWSYEFAIGTILSKMPHLITFRDHSQSILKLTKHPYRLTRLFMDLWVRKRGKNFSFNSTYLKSLVGVEGAVIANPIKNSEITNAKKHPGKDRKVKICYIANGWDYRKNPESAIDGFNLLMANKDINAELHLIGKGFEPEGEHYNHLTKNGILNNILFRGPMPHVALMEELKGFDIMLHTAREESFGNNLIESMAKGIPVIGGQSAGAVPWVLDYGKAGYLVDIESPVKIAEALFTLINDSVLYEQLSMKGISNLQSRFSQEKVCDAYINEFLKILNKLD
jgi:glycosyltransferase involved in cell wall biosynthesis